MFYSSSAAAIRRPRGRQVSGLACTVLLILTLAIGTPIGRAYAAAPITAALAPANPASWPCSDAYQQDECIYGGGPAYAGLISEGLMGQCTVNWQVNWGDGTVEQYSTGQSVRSDHQPHLPATRQVQVQPIWHDRRW
jgi:hypothetical protein